MATKSKPKKTASKKVAAKKTTDRRQKDIDAEKLAAPSKAPSTVAPPQPRDDSGEIVVFAIRLRRSERDLIHDAAGPAKASSFVKGLALAAARGDMKTVTEIVDDAHGAK
jgi:hypothetical protein